MKKMISSMGLAVFFLVGCLQRPPDEPVVYLETVTPTAVSSPTQTVQVHASPTVILTVVPTEAPTIVPPTPLPTLPPIIKSTELSPAGPWLLLTTDETVWALNGDGSGLTKIAEIQKEDGEPIEVNFGPRDFQVFPASSGGRVAIIRLDKSGASSNPLLSILQFPTGKNQPITRLLSEDIFNQLNYGSFAIERYDELMQIFAAVGVDRSPAWSPDGSQLAFSAALDGETSDLYLYSTVDNSIARLTDGESEAVDPVWSPDGEMIVHGAVSSLNFGRSGAGYNDYDVWVAYQNQLEPTFVYAGIKYGFEDVFGWLDSQTFLVDNWGWESEYQNMRQVDALTGETKTLWCGYYNFRYYDLPSNTIFLSGFVTGFPELSDCEESVQTGLYIISPEDNSLYEVGDLGIEDDAWWRLPDCEWSELSDSLNCRYSDRQYRINSQGEIAEVPLVLSSSFDGTYQVSIKRREFKGEFWITSGEKEILVYTKYVTWHSWNPTSNQLFFISRDQLFVAQAPNFSPKLILDLPQEVNNTYWVMP